MIEAWIFPDWPAPSRVYAAVTTRDGPGISQLPFARFNLGLRNGDDVQTVRANRNALRQSLDLPAEPRWLRQVHGTVVAELGPLPSPEEPEADAAVSRLPGTVLAILTADCLPVLFCADDGSAIGAAHAGWRGLAGGVLEETVEQMQRPAAELMAWLGPCIGAISYEVGEEVRAAFPQRPRLSWRHVPAIGSAIWRCWRDSVCRRPVLREFTVAASIPASIRAFIPTAGKARAAAVSPA
jgi:YfiH family protein